MGQLLGVADVRNAAGVGRRELMPSRSPRRSALNTGVCAALVMACAASAHAHELGATRVSVLTKEDRTYSVEIVTDAASLVEKLEASVGQSLRPDSSPERLQSLLTRLDDSFRQRVKLAFDGSEVRPAIEYVVSPGPDAVSAPAATIRLTGGIPPSAGRLTWSYGWTSTSYAVMIRHAAAEKATVEWLEGNQLSSAFAVASSAPDRLGAARRYFTLGFTHMVPMGVDHILFVLGLYLLSGRARSVLWQVSAFTVAHSISLALSLYGVVAVSPRIVEPLIAVSIAYVAIENIVSSELNPWRVALVFGFGLLHGMGFAGALKELGLPRSEFVTALLTFNVGVEAAQLALIGTAFVLIGWHVEDRGWYRTRVVIPASVLIACTGLYWTIQRL
jgi:hydrogenase/urease accessory protein HupE